MIDCQDSELEDAKVACSLNADHIVALAALYSTHNRKVDSNEKAAKELFQNVFSVDLCGYKIHVISNWLLGVACIAKKNGDQTAQVLAARYFFT